MFGGVEILFVLDVRSDLLWKLRSTCATVPTYLWKSKTGIISTCTFFDGLSMSFLKTSFGFQSQSQSSMESQSQSSSVDKKISLTRVTFCLKPNGSSHSKAYHSTHGFNLSPGFFSRVSTYWSFVLWISKIIFWNFIRNALPWWTNSASNGQIAWLAKNCPFQVPTKCSACHQIKRISR